MEYIVQIWQNYPVLLDLALYFFVFAAAARAALAKTFPGTHGKTLAVAVGLTMATSLTLAQSRLGLSLESLGGIAGLVLSGIVGITTYHFMKQNSIPTRLAIFLAGLIALAALRTAMPQFTSGFIRDNLALVSLAVAGLMVWAWMQSNHHARTLLERRPGMVLARHKDVPGTRLLDKAKFVVKKGMRRSTRQDRKSEARVDSAIQKAIAAIEKDGITAENKAEIARHLEEAESRAGEIAKRVRQVRELDTNLARFDVEWLKRARKVDLAALPKSQQEAVKATVLDERKRLRAEQHLAELEAHAEHKARELEAKLGRARQCIATDNASGAVGWLLEAEEENRALESIEAEAAKWEGKLASLIKREEHDLEAPSHEKPATAPSV